MPVHGRIAFPAPALGLLPLCVSAPIPLHVLCYALACSTSFPHGSQGAHASSSCCNLPACVPASAGALLWLLSYATAGRFPTCRSTMSLFHAALLSPCFPICTVLHRFAANTCFKSAQGCCHVCF